MSDTKFSDMSEAEMVKRNSASMKRLEGIWDEVAQRMDARAGDDRCGRDAKGTARARKICYMIHALHSEMDEFAAEFGGVPVARTGEGR